MGWLRDLMNYSAPPIPSFGQLAEACLGHTEWPADQDLQPRSLATLFSKLDRGQELDWLRDRPLVMRVVALAMNRPVGDVRAAVGEPELAPSGRILRLSDVRFARQLDLSREELPPGVPDETLYPPAWGPLFWRAPAGSGRSLVGAWLKARGLAEWVELRSDGDLARVPARGAVFVEVVDDFTLAPAHLDMLRMGSRPVCIAATRLGEGARELSSVSSPSVASVVRPLVDWVHERLDNSGEFEPAFAERWLETVALPSGAVRTLGDALGLCGVLDEIKPRSLSGRTLDEVAALFVKKRVERAAADTSWGPAVRSRAYDALGAAAARCLVEVDERLGEPRALESWARLLTEGMPEAVDGAWARVALRELGGAEVSHKELARLERKLPPLGYQLARTLELAELLRRPLSHVHPRDDRRVVLGPRWLVTLLEERAASHALDLAPSEWGLALLSDDSAPSVLAQLTERLLRGHFETAERLLDDFDARDVARAAALEGLVVAVGRAAALGAHLPDHFLSELVGAENDALTVLGDGVEPRLLASQRDEFIVGLTVATRSAPLALLDFDPHRTGQVGVRASAAGAAARVARSGSEVQASTLLALAREVFPPELRAQDDGGCVDVPPVLLLLDALGSGAPRARSPELAATLLSYPLEALLVTLERSGLLDGARVWSTLATLDTEALARALDGAARGRLGRALVGSCPSPLLARLLSKSAAPASLWSVLLPHQYEALLGSEGFRLPPAGAEGVPLEAARAALSARGSVCFEPAALARVLGRSPERMALTVAERLAKVTQEEARALLGACHGAIDRSLLDALPNIGTLLTWKADTRAELRRYLLALLAAKGDTLALAHARLDEMDRAERPRLRLGQQPGRPGA